MLFKSHDNRYIHYFYFIDDSYSYLYSHFYDCLKISYLVKMLAYFVLCLHSLSILSFLYFITSMIIDLFICYRLNKGVDLVLLTLIEYNKMAICQYFLYLRINHYLNRF